jgi:hypothetical protein
MVNHPTILEVPFTSHISHLATVLFTEAGPMGHKKAVPVQNPPSKLEDQNTITTKDIKGPGYQRLNETNQPKSSSSRVKDIREFPLDTKWTISFRFQRVGEMSLPICN